ncbi:MAG TPA: cobalamin-binding protein [Candidatus Dormibacteraeota bacterium]|nr:cobalamin-binding protein [Candidatus Dormibacteraeota bacterium]
MRICSLLPAATEILFAIGAGADVAGVTHECDYPPEAAARPPLIRPRIDVHAAPGEIDRQVRQCVESGQSVYVVDADRLRQIDPDLVVTQDLCHVCCASPDDLSAALSRFDAPPRVISLSPQRLSDVWQDIRTLGDATGRRASADALVEALENRIRVVQTEVRAAAPVRTLCLEWLDPPFVGGHWVPEMVESAGGIAVLAQAGVPSVALEWAEVLDSRPDEIILMPCGYDLDKTLAEYSQSRMPPGWWRLPAVIAGRVTAVNANSYFSRPGPRLAGGVEILARILHPDVATTPVPSGSWATVRREAGSGLAGGLPGT